MRADHPRDVDEAIRARPRRSDGGEDVVEPDAVVRGGDVLHDHARDRGQLLHEIRDRFRVPRMQRMA